MDNTSPSKKPFIIVGQDDLLSDEPSSPFHAMEEEGDSMMVKANPSDFSLPDQEEQVEAKDGILLVRMSNSSTRSAALEVEKGSTEDDDNSSTYSTLKVFEGSADFDYDMQAGK